jgi:hypothetical protein
LGAVLQGLVVLVIPVSYAVLPPILILSYLLAKTGLMTLGIIKNPGMDGVVMGKFTALLPDRNGVFSGKAADQDVALILLAARSNQYVLSSFHRFGEFNPVSRPTPNSPMGIFGPGFKELGDYMKKMQAQLANDAIRYNCEQVIS